MFRILFILFILFCCRPEWATAQSLTDSLPDSSAIVQAIENLPVDEIVDKAEPPKADKVQYVSQLTRYGFKNLFNKYKYNPALPYTMQVNPNAETYMQDYLRKHSGHLTKMKTWGVPYFNLIDRIFTQYGLPTELKYLAVIESNLQTSATSWVGAGGPWQFMPYTARDYGLVVNAQFDERRDYLKSTHAAAKYLLTLYKQMHDWLLVIAAYNGGPGRVYEAIRKSGSRNFWDLQYYLPQESRNHVKKFIATHYIMESAGSSSIKINSGDNREPYTLDNNPDLPKALIANTQKQTISGKYSAKIIAQNLSMDIAEFNKYNPAFDQHLGSNGQYDLLLPADKMELFLANKYHILNESVQSLLKEPEIMGTKTVYPKKRKG